MPPLSLTGLESEAGLFPTRRSIMSWRFVIPFIVALGGCSASSSPTAPLPGEPANRAVKAAENGLGPEEAKALVSEAAGIKRDELDKLAAEPETNIDPTKLRNLPLTLLCYFLDRSVDFHYHGDRSSFSQYALAIGKNRDVAFSSVILPDQVANCLCETDGETAKGTLSFKTGNICDGQVEFTAHHREGRWRIEQLWLPTDEIGVYLGADGQWKMTDSH
jgi:hypothetical protein